MVENVAHRVVSLLSGRMKELCVKHAVDLD